MSEVAKIELDGKVYELPVITGTENEKAIDISKLRDLTGYVTLDTGYKNTGATNIEHFPTIQPIRYYYLRVKILLTV